MMMLMWTNIPSVCFLFFVSEIFVHINTHSIPNQDVSAAVITTFQHSIITYSL